MARAHKKNRDGAEEEEDRISSLPDELIHVIFSFMGSAEYAVRTCLLSTRWKNVWASLPHLNLDHHGFRLKPEFSKFVRGIFPNRNHTAAISTINFNSSWTIEPTLFKRILRCGFSRGIQHLNFNFRCRNRWRRSFQAPLSLLSSRSLKHLSLTSFPSKTIISAWNLPNLTSLYLNGVQFRFQRNNGKDHKSADIFSNLVNLKDLTLLHYDFPDQDALNIISVTLEDLTIRSSSYQPRTYMYVVCVPSLKSFEYAGILPLLSTTEPLNYLSEATIAVTSSGSPSYDAERMHMMISLVPNAAFLTLSSQTAEILLAASRLLDRASPFANLKCLTIKVGSHFSAVSNDILTYFLITSPNASIETMSESGRRTKLH